MSEIFNLIYENDEIPIYDLCGRMGMTDYIDFIKEEEIKENIVKGIDVYNRKFIIFKANYIYSTGKKHLHYQQYFKDIVM